MKGFGESDNNQQKSKRNYINAPNDNEKLISDAFRFQSIGNFNDAAKIYRHLIKNGMKDPRIFINLGGIYQQLKQYKEAIPLYEYAIKTFPNSPEAYSNLGQIFQDKGEVKNAINYMEKAIKLKPDFLIAYQNLIKVYLNQGLLKEAGNILKKCSEIFPKDFNTFINYGCVLKELGEVNEAENYLKKSIELKSNVDISYINLAAVQKELGKLFEAEKNISKALEINPNSSLAYNNLGNIYNASGRIAEAEKSYRKAIELNPKDYLSYNNLGSLFSTKGDLINGEKLTQLAVDINPKFELAYVNLGLIKTDLDKIDEAESCFKFAINIKKDYQYAYRSLWNLYEKTNNLEKLKNHLNHEKDNKFLKNELLLFKSRISFREKKYDLAKQLIDKIPENWPDTKENFTRILFWSFKGFIEEKVNNFDIAYVCFSNSQKNSKFKNCNSELYIKYIREYEESMRSFPFSKIKKDYLFKKEIKLVFLIGFPRSGTTLLDTILRSHSYIDVVEEKPLIYSVEKIIKTKLDLKLNQIYQIKEKDLNYLRAHYMDLILKEKDPNKEASVIVDKFPFQTVCLPLINLLFPDAKIIFAHRNPYDTVLSCFQQTFEPNNAMANFTTIKKSAQIYDLTMSMWINYQKNLSLNFVMSKYEDLLDNFDIHVNEIIKFLNLEWDENIKNYRNTALKRGKINTPSSSQVVQPLYKTSIAKWKNYEKYFEDSKKYLEKWSKHFNY